MPELREIARREDDLRKRELVSTPRTPRARATMRAAIHGAPSARDGHAPGATAQAGADGHRRRLTPPYHRH